MKIYIKASIDIEDYRDCYIAFEGNGYVIYDSSDDSKIGSGYNSIEEAEREIDSWNNPNNIFDVPTVEQRRLGKELYYRFIDYLNIPRNSVDMYGYIHTTKMFKGAHITLSRLESALKSFNNRMKDDKFEQNGVFLYIDDRGQDYRICIDYIL